MSKDRGVEKLHNVVSFKLGLQLFVYLVGLLISLFCFILVGEPVSDSVYSEMLNKYHLVYIYDTDGEANRSSFFLESVLPCIDASIAEEIFYRDMLEYADAVTSKALQRFEDNNYNASASLDFLNKSDPRLARFTSVLSDSYCGEDSVLCGLDDIQAMLDLTYSFLSTNPKNEDNLHIYFDKFTEFREKAAEPIEGFSEFRKGQVGFIWMTYSLLYMAVLWVVRVGPYLASGKGKVDTYRNLDELSRPRVHNSVADSDGDVTDEERG